MTRVKYRVPEGMERYTDDLAFNPQSKTSDPRQRHCLRHGVDLVSDGGGPGPFSYCPVCRSQSKPVPLETFTDFCASDACPPPWAHLGWVLGP